MKITAPANQEMDAVLDADEFYAGHMPKGWNKKFGILASPSRRYFTESHAIDGISKIVLKAGRKPVYITYNSPLYNGYQKKMIIKDMKLMVKKGIKGFIISDFTLIKYIKEIEGNTKVHISTVGNVFNQRTARFYFELGADKIILPRQLKIDEVSQITKAVPGKYEVFMLFDLCRNIDGMCAFQHGLETSLGYDHGCLYLKRYKPAEGTKECKRKNIKFPMFCGACYIDKFKKIGIHSVKIVGRRLPHELKEKGVLFIREVINGADPKKSYAKHFLRNCPMIKANYY
jgi:U32 family peptidase